MDLTKVLKYFASKSKTVFDVGAFKGELAAELAGAVPPDGKVFAFEPHPFSFIELSIRSVLVPSGNLFPQCKAVGDKRGWTQFWVPAQMHPSVEQACTTRPDLANSERLGEQFAELKVEMCTLDDFCEELSLQPDLIKIDVEGAEPHVFAGANDILRKFLPALFFECHIGAEYDHRHPGYLEFLGYNLFIADVMRYKEDWIGLDSPIQNQLLLPFRAYEMPLIPTVLTNIAAIHESKMSIAEGLVSPIPARGFFR